MSSALPKKCVILIRGKMQEFLCHAGTGALLVFSKRKAAYEYLLAIRRVPRLRLLELGPDEVIVLVDGAVADFILDLKIDTEDPEVFPLPRLN